jgi:DNA-binding CsgD family transcriptional regulator/PAS domain-containing protein
MSYDPRFLRLLDTLYEAALEASAWPLFLNRLCEELDGHSACLLSYDATEQRARANVAVGLDPTAPRVYSQHYGALDPWARSLRSAGQLKGGIVRTGESVIDRASLRKTEFYIDYGRPYGIVHNVFALEFEPSASTGFVLTVIRGDRAEPFGDGAVDVVNALKPHVQRALGIQSRLTGAFVPGREVGDVLEHLQFGVILLNAAGQVVFVNRMASEIAAACDGLRLEGCTLRASHRDATPVLQRMIASVLNPQSPGPPGRGGTLALPRRSSKRPLALTIAPLPANPERVGTANATAVVFVVDPERQTEPTVETIRRLYGLTEMESQMARLIATGQSVKEAADHLRITESTARTHLKRILGKTQTRRQSQLVRLLLGGSVQLIKP